jgi:hypothetical protein
MAMHGLGNISYFTNICYLILCFFPLRSSSLLPTMDKLRSVNDGVDLLESWDYPV